MWVVGIERGESRGAAAKLQYPCATVRCGYCSYEREARGPAAGLRPWLAREKIFSSNLLLIRLIHLFSLYREEVLLDP
jgi:hypothetical protein